MGYTPWCRVSRLGRALFIAAPRLSRNKDFDMLLRLVSLHCPAFGWNPIEAKTYPAAVLLLLESSNSSEGLVLSTGNIVSESAKP